MRSEESQAGKECRYRLTLDQSKINKDRKIADKARRPIKANIRILDSGKASR